MSQSARAAAAPLPQLKYGGQALLEGVMMRGSRSVAVAVRHPDGRIVTHTEPLNRTIYDSRLLKLPFLRGLLMLWDALVLGTRMLVFSANVALPEEEDELGGWPLVLTVVASLTFAVALFFLLPLWVSHLLAGPLGSPLAENLVEGVLRLAIVLAYLAAIGKMPDIRRVFGYHGAEHKTINAFERGLELSLPNVAGCPISHPRCGTAFLLWVVIVSIFVFSLLGRPALVWLVASRVLLLPLIAGVSYEFIRLGARHFHKRWVRALLAPSLALQALTTREPDESMLEVAIRAFELLREEEGRELPLVP